MNDVASRSVANRINGARSLAGSAAGSTSPGIGGSGAGAVQRFADGAPVGAVPLSTERTRAPITRFTGEMRTKSAAIFRTAVSASPSTRHCRSRSGAAVRSGDSPISRARRQPVSGIVPGRHGRPIMPRTPGPTRQPAARDNAAATTRRRRPRTYGSRHRSRQCVRWPGSRASRAAGVVVRRPLSALRGSIPPETALRCVRPQPCGRRDVFRCVFSTI